ncbi:MAG: UDP-N-acetylmuramoyl-L-alanine--D-glutamate ligase [Ruminococcaceae bacterium]|nr:UDP-N-acetylmuramoyl-L-alanine--D-glutamate ligase [Oscillospiraceae bacterium]
MTNVILQEYLEIWKHKRLAVLGLGVSNRPLVRLLLTGGCRVLGCDRTPREKLDEEVLELERMGCELRVGEGYLDNLEADVVFRTPGMHPGNPALELLRAKGAEIVSEMEIFFRCCPCPIIAVTGSDGKTTTTTLIAEMLKTAGYMVHLGGNIGRPLLPDVEEMLPEHWAVVELSSFQLMDMTRSPRIAVVTNVAPNHLDVHKDMAEYISAKANVFRFQKTGDVVVLNRDNDITRGFADSASGTVRWFSRQERGSGVWLEGETIYRATAQGKEKLMTREDILLPGIHNVENYMTAMAALEGLVAPEHFLTVARNFGGVEHRIELVRELDGIRFYNDSIASSPTRTIAGLRSFREKVILIAGGYDKQIPYDVLGPEICAHVKCLVTTGATGEKIRKATEEAENYIPGQPEILCEPEFDRAVTAAYKQAKPGDVVLLSPASAAFDQFKNFMVRGRHFKDLVRNL